ncbi:MAG: Nitroreductase [Frankiales bacterium]|nr:Nitroreductase [Frankiales bacterium]
MSTPSAVTPAWPAEPEASCDDTEARLRWYASQARWAPSKHNSQPWRFVLTGDALEVWPDPSRVLAETDPSRRELVLSCGAAMHLAAVAARAHGVVPLVTVLPDGEGGCAARLVEGGAHTVTRADRDLLDAVPRRRTDRGPLDAAVLPPTLAFELRARAAGQGGWLHTVVTPGDRASLSDLVARADRLLVRAGGVDRELAGWLREPTDPRTDGVPVESTRGPAASYRAEYVQRDFSTPESKAGHDRPGPDRPLIAVLCTPADGASDRVRAGAALSAVLLHATVAGASCSYLNQPVEHAPSRLLLRENLRLDGVPQLVLRLGRGGAVSRPPRRPEDELVFKV